MLVVVLKHFGLLGGKESKVLAYPMLLDLRTCAYKMLQDRLPLLYRLCVVLVHRAAAQHKATITASSALPKTSGSASMMMTMMMSSPAPVTQHSASRFICCFIQESLCSLLSF